MKKFLTGIIALLMVVSVSMAQTPAAPAKATKKEKATTEKKATDASAKPLKKDGTPDKRYKENKGTATEGPKKKDGTPDKRYKANKTENTKQ
jgi:hypothetical protein